MIWNNIEIPLTVTVDEAILSHEGYGNPLQLNLIWNLKRASNFEYGNNSEGIAQEVDFSHEGRKNSDGQYEMGFTTALLWLGVGSDNKDDTVREIREILLEILDEIEKVRDSLSEG